MAVKQTPEWDAYDLAMAQYRLDLQAWESSTGVSKEKQAAATAHIVSLQTKAAALTAQIASKAERVWDTEMTSMANLELALETGFGSLKALYGEIDADPISETRFYVATFVTDWGEESAPSPVSDMVEPNQYDRVDVTTPAPPAGRHITLVRLYRSNAGADSAPFQFVTERAVTEPTAYQDKLKGAQLGELLASATWLEPPENLQGLIGVPNGIMAGFFDNTLCFSDPYHPYAWPVEYQITTEFPIVGLGVFGQSLFVGTTANPYIVSGSDSASMSALKMESSQACVSADSIAAVPGGVLYASPDGLCLASGGQVQVVTGGMFTRDEWQALVPTTIEAIESEGVYYMRHGGTRPGTYALDLPSRKLIRVDLNAKAFFVDRQKDALYGVSGSSLNHVFGSATFRTGLWRSGRNAIPKHAGLAWMQANLGHKSLFSPVYVRLRGDGWRIGMYGDLLKEQPDGTLVRSGDGHVFAYEGKNLRNQTTSALLTYGTPEFDRIHCTAKAVGNQPLRLPPGRWREYEIEVESAERVSRLTFAGDTAELQAI